MVYHVKENRNTVSSAQFTFNATVYFYITTLKKELYYIYLTAIVTCYIADLDKIFHYK